MVRDMFMAGLSVAALTVAIGALMVIAERVRHGHFRQHRP